MTIEWKQRSVCLINGYEIDARASTGRDYGAITLGDVFALVEQPGSDCIKGRAPAVIYSSYCSDDARKHSAQKERGSFAALWLDIDDGGHALDTIADAVSEIAARDFAWAIYSTASATEHNPRWRVIVPLAEPLPFGRWAIAQRTLARLLCDRSIANDTVTERAGQVAILPISKPFYQAKSNKDEDALDINGDWFFEAAMLETENANQQVKLEEAISRMAKPAGKLRQERQSIKPFREDDPIQWFNDKTSIADMLSFYGYVRKGPNSNNWRSPLQTSKSYATGDFGDYWVSLSGSDAAAGLGAVCGSGRYGDAFDLFVYFEHGGDFTAAVKVAGAEMPGCSVADFPDLSGGSAHIQNSARSFDDLLDGARALDPDDGLGIAEIVVECEALNPIERRQVFQAIKDSTRWPFGVLNVQRRSEQGPEPDHLELARQVIDLKGDANILCSEAHVWRWQASGVWTSLDDRAVKQDVQSALDVMPSLEVMSGTVNAVAEVLKTEIFVQGHQFNQGNPEVVNCLNGQVELVGDSWELKAHRREDYRTTQIPVAYDPNATAPKFEAFLAQIFEGDEDKDQKRRSLLELIGYTLMSHARHEKFIILIGAGANGKSVLLSVLYALVGPENVAGVQPSSFENRFQRAHLNQKLANIVTELRQGEALADAELKAITSGEPATVEHKHKDPFVMRPFATCWFGTNHMPHTRDFSEALFRRATILTFNRVFAPHEQDPMLKEKLMSELPGILTMALNAYAVALGLGFTAPQSSNAAKNEWRLEADQVAMFVEESCERNLYANTAIGELYSAYQTWAAESGIGKTVSMKTMRDRLTRLGFGNQRDRTARLVTGLRINKTTNRGW